MMKFGRSVPAAIIGALTLSLTANGQAPHSGSTKAFIGATVIDGTGGKPLPDAVVVVRGQKIVALGPAKTTSVPPEATKIDVSGRTIVPR